MPKSSRPNGHSAITWDIQSLSLLTEIRTCQCGRQYDAPSPGFRINMTAGRSRATRQSKAGDNFAILRNWFPLVHEIVQVSVPACQACTPPTQTFTDPQGSLWPPIIPNPPRQMRGDTILSGTEPPVEKKPKVYVPSLSDF